MCEKELTHIIEAARTSRNSVLHVCCINNHGFATHAYLCREGTGLAHTRTCVIQRPCVFQRPCEHELCTAIYLCRSCCDRACWSWAS